MRFVDTNILLYSVSGVADEAAKKAAARQLLLAKDLALSVQVLQEFYVQAIRPSRPHALSHADAVAVISGLRRFPIQQITVPIFQAALATKARWQLSYWDAAIIESARALGCREVLSEDLQDGADYAGVRVRNPFAPAAG